MRAVDCAACGAVVAARKSSWDQTSLQWDAAAQGRCLERASYRSDQSDRPNRHGFPGCSAMVEAVREAAVRGALDVQSPDPLPTNPSRTDQDDLGGDR